MAPRKIKDIYRLIALGGKPIFRSAGPNEYLLTVKINFGSLHPRKIRYLVKPGEIVHLPNK